jgi:hypothetical protein
MTIEQLTGLSGSELEVLASDELKLQEHFGWALCITRPSKDKPLRQVKLSARAPKAPSAKVIEDAKLHAAMEYAKDLQAKLGIKIV